MKLHAAYNSHMYAVCLHPMFYNYVRAHETLTRRRGGTQITPAMTAGKRTVLGPFTICYLRNGR